MPPDKEQSESGPANSAPGASSARPASQLSDPSAPTLAVNSDDVSLPTMIDQGQGLLGKTLDGRYLIDKQLGRGGMGQVFVARDLQLHSRPVVVKLLLEEAYQNEYIVKKFHQEIEALSRLDHPGVIGIIDSGELADGKPFIVMQYVDGVTLRSILKPEGMEFERAGDLVRQMGRALTAAHDKGVFHRDLKPENIMLQDLGHGVEQVKVIDFGIAKIKNSMIAPTTATTATAGTIAYMAPEQLSAKPIGASSDIFSLGVIAYEMVAGRRPFNPETGFELLELQRAGVRIRPSDLRPSLPEHADRLILKALSFEPKDRYRSAREFGDALARALAHEDETFEPEARSMQETVTAVAQTGDPATNRQRKVNTSETAPEWPAAFDPTASQPQPAPRPRAMFSLNFSWLKIAVGLFSVVIISSIAFRVFLTQSSPPSASARRSLPTTTLAPAIHSLTYWLTVQKMRDGKPFGEAFQSSGQEIFESGYKFRLNISAPQAGYLYVFNEGATDTGDMSFNIIFPTPLQNGGSPKVDANYAVQTSWNTFVGGSGTEEFWLISSLNPVPELEAAKESAFQSAGKVTDAGLLRNVREFLIKHSEPKPEATKDKLKQQTILRGTSDPLVQLLELEHR